MAQRSEGKRTAGNRTILVLGGLLLVALLLTLFGEVGLVNTWKLQRKSSHLQEEIETLRAENERLRHEVEALRSNRAYIEQRARELGLIRPQEKVIISDPETGNPRSAPSRNVPGRP